MSRNIPSSWERPVKETTHGKGREKFQRLSQVEDARGGEEESGRDQVKKTTHGEMMGGGKIVDTRKKITIQGGEGGKGRHQVKNTGGGEVVGSSRGQVEETTKREEEGREKVGQIRQKAIPLVRVETERRWAKWKRQGGGGRGKDSARRLDAS